MSTKEFEPELVELLRSQGRYVEPQASGDHWEPVMSPSQRAFFYDRRRYLLAHGERGSGKTITALHKLVDHCYRNTGALAAIIVLTKGSAESGGAWEDLTGDDLFEEGPLAGTPAGVLAMWRDGIGLQYSDAKEDGSKNKIIEIRTHDGGISRVILKSIPHPSQIKDRMRISQFSFILVEELTNTYDRAYFVKMIQQLFRRRTVKAAEQQYVATCNPAEEGKDHWAYPQFFIPGKDLQTQQQLSDEQHQAKYGVHHVKMSENEWMPDKDLYIEGILEECQYDPTAYNRLILGQWEKMEIGEGIFETFYMPEIHKKGDKTRGLVPFKNELITIGYDPGNVNNSRVFMQRSKVNSRYVWRIFDEIINTKARLSDTQLVLPIMERMRFWNERMGCIFAYEHIADRAAFNQFNPSGSYVYREWGKISAWLCANNPRYKQLTAIRMKSPPKGADSIEARVKSLINKLATDQLMVSATCPKVCDMFGRLKRAKDKFDNDELFIPSRTTKHIHVFDAGSYPIYYYDLLLAELDADSASDEEDEPEVLSFS